MQKKILLLITALSISPGLLSMSFDRFNTPHIKSATQALARLLSHEELEQSLAETNAAREEWESTSAVKQELQGLEKELDSLRKLQEDPHNMLLPYEAEASLPELFARNDEEADKFREVMALERTPNNAIAPQKLAALAVCAAPKKQQGAKRKRVNKAAQQPPRKKQARQAARAEGPYSCGTCKRSFKQIGNLTNHEKSHVLHICAECKNGFPTAWQLEQHTRTHTKERPFPCKQNCGKTFADPSSRRRHEKNHINPNKGNFYCYTCHTEYKYKKSFINHECNV